MKRLTSIIFALGALLVLSATARADHYLYTAVASDSTGAYGACWAYTTLVAASNCAVQECEAVSSGRCDVFLTCESEYANYGAIARSSDGSLGAACGYDRQGQAATAATDQCAAATSRGTRNTCEVTDVWFETY